MPYRVNPELSPAASAYLPARAQATYRDAFNHAYAAHSYDADREQRLQTIAWAAVKRLYVKTDDDGWLPRGEVAARS